jgi:hypothetical protein
MPLIHAYRRTNKCDVEFSNMTFTFDRNGAGDFVCDVPPGPELDRLLGITEGYKLYSDGPGESSEEDVQDDKGSDKAPASKYVLINDGETIDLRALDRSALLEFIDAQGLTYTPRADTSDNSVRDKIVKLLTGG